MFRLLATQGIVGLWEMVKDKIGDLKSMVMDAIEGFVIGKVITEGIQWLLSLLNPASAFVKACQAIYRIVSFFISRAAQIADLINAILDSIVAIASGNIGQMAKAVEGALGKTIPVVISFLASLLGLDGIAAKIQAIIQKVRQPIEKVIDWVIGKAVAFAKKIGGKVKNSKVGKKVGALKSLPFSRLWLFPFRHKIIAEFIQTIYKRFPGVILGNKNYRASYLFYVNLFPFELKLLRESYSLTFTVFKKLCGIHRVPPFGIYFKVYTFYFY